MKDMSHSLTHTTNNTHTSASLSLTNGNLRWQKYENVKNSENLICIKNFACTYVTIPKTFEKQKKVFEESTKQFFFNDKNSWKK